VESDTALDAGSLPGVVIVSAVPVLTAVEQLESEYTLYVTVPVAVAALVPDRVAESVTAVFVGTEMVVPDWPPPESEVETVVGSGRTVCVTVSTSEPHGLVEPPLLVSPEYDACQ